MSAISPEELYSMIDEAAQHLLGASAGCLSRMARREERKELIELDLLEEETNAGLA